MIILAHSALSGIEAAMRGAVTQAKQTHWWIVLGLAAVAFFLVGILSVVHASSARAADDVSTGLTYTDNGADITVTGCIGGVESCPTALTIPDTINSKPVTNITNYAFYLAANLHSVSLGANVSAAGLGPFGRTGVQTITVDPSNTHYKSVGNVLFTADGTVLVQYPTGSTSGSYTTPSGVLTIGDSAFAGATPLTSVLIGDSVTTISNWAFWRASGLTSVTLGPSVTGIGYSAFGYAESLGSISLGPAITSIGSYAFYGATSLHSVTLGPNVSTIGAGPFGRTSVQDVTVDPGNTNYKGSDNILYTADGSVLVQYPPGSMNASFTTPNGVVAIGDSAFAGAAALTSISIGDSVTTISDWAFWHATGLASVTVGQSVTSVGAYAFGDAPAITSITFEGAGPQFGESAFIGSGSAPIYHRSGASSWDTVSNPLNDHPLVAVDPPTITDQPDAVSVTQGQTAHLHVAADVHTGGGTPSYQWKKSGEPVANATSADLEVQVNSGAETGDYTVDVTSWAGTVTSDTAAVAILPAPTSNGLRYSFDGVNATVIGCVGACASTVTIPDTIAVNAVDRPVVAIDAYALASETALTHLSIGNNIRAIGLSAFQSDSALAEVTLGDSVESIDAMAFGFTPSLQAVTIPSSVTSINPRSFLSSGLTDLTVDSNNQQFKDIGGVLFSKSGTTLVSYPAGRSATTYSIPFDTLTVGEAAFVANGALASMVVGNNVTTIQPYAFNSATSLAELTIGSSVQTIGDGAFSGTEALTAVRLFCNTPTFGNSVFSSSGSGPLYYLSSSDGDWPESLNGRDFVAVDGPVVTSLTESLTMNAGASTTLAVTTADPWEKTYQWSHGADTLIGQTSATLNLTNLQPSDAGNYRVKITNWSGETYSDVITVTVNAAPALQPPTNAPPATKANQTLSWKPKAKLKKNAKYTLPATTSQGEALNWKVSGAGGCKIKAGKLSCSKSTGKKAIKLVATASATATLNAFAASFKAKVG